MVAALRQVELTSPPETSRPRRRPRWVHRASVDVVVAACWIPFVVVAHALEFRPGALAAFVSGIFLLSFAHQPLTLALVYGDGEQFRMRRAIFTWSPLVLAVVILVVLHVSVLALAIVAGLWNAEHTLMQRYGITRIYGRKAGQQDGGLERAMLLSWLALAMVWVAADRGTATRLHRLAMGGTNEMAVKVLIHFRTWAAPLLVPALVLVAALVAAWVVTEHRRGPAANPAKWLYLGSTAALFAVVVVDPIAGLMGYVGAHALEYFVIVHQSLGKRFADDQPVPSSPLGRAVRARTGRLGFFAAYLAAVIAIVMLLHWRGSPDAYLVVFFTLGGLHVFYDGFIWKLRRPAVAQSLSIPVAGAS